MQEKHSFAPKQSILDLRSTLLFLKETGLLPNSYARGWMS